MLQRLNITGTDLHTSPIGLGVGAWGSAQSIDEADVICGAYLGHGGNLFDSAHCYAFWRPGGDGQSERTLGELIRRHKARERVIICTKGGHSDAGEAYPRPRQCLRPDLIRRDVDESLQRLGFETIDLYFLHRDDGVTPVQVVLETLNDLIRAGKLRWIGASNWSTRRIADANQYAALNGMRGFCASQVQWSLATPAWQISEDPTMRHLEGQDREWHASTRLPVLAYSSTAGGFFDGAKRESFDTPQNHARRVRATQLANEMGCSAGQIALAWLLHQSFPVVPLTSTHCVSHLVENLNAVQIRLSAEQVRWLAGD